MRAVGFLISIACGAAACGGSSAPQQASQSASEPPAPLIAMPAGPDDVVVARVNGKPVYGACLKAQAARGASKQDALQQCIDFELLAQQATGFATDPEVVLATRTALVNEIIAREYEDKFTRPAEFGPFWDQMVARNRQHVSHGEVRASAYVRVPVAAKASAADDAAAKAAADELAAALAGERGLMAPHLEKFAQSVIGTRAKYEIAVVPPYLNEGGLVDEYAKPLFGITEVGRTWPTAVRSQWGWDVILLTELIPAAHPTPEEVIKQALPEVKRSYFSLWVAQVAQKLGVTPKIFDDKLPLLEDL